MRDADTAPVAEADWTIANAAVLKPIVDIAERLGVAPGHVEPYGRYKAKLDMDFVAETLAGGRDGKLILVTAINPTPAGEGKTTTTVGLGDALNRIGKRASICLREPSLGPCFGMKGGAAGGGRAQVAPMDELNLHFTGDFHAIGVANNLLAAMVDNHIYWGNALGIDPARVTWRRCLDINDRALRNIALSSSGSPTAERREDGFDITVASEVMAILCLSTSVADLERRLANIVVALDREGAPVRASDLKAHGAMTAVLKDAIKPNLVQTLENNPVFVHGGPFANIAHGCNSVLATRVALRLSDYVVTEVGFGADLGAEKFFDIKCRKSGLRPDLGVLVATVRALKYHGGVAREALGREDVAAVRAGMANAARHIENLRKFGVPPVVAINVFTSDTPAEIAAVMDACAALGVEAAACTHWADGGAGAQGLAELVVRAIDRGEADFRVLYPDALPLLAKLQTVAREIYHADRVELSPAAADKLRTLQALGFDGLPVCIAKTQYSNSSNPELRGAPNGHVLEVRELRLAAGAEFVVAICGQIMTLPGLPRTPAAETIGLDAQGRIFGLS